MCVDPCFVSVSGCDRAGGSVALRFNWRNNFTSAVPNVSTHCFQKLALLLSHPLIFSETFCGASAIGAPLSRTRIVKQVSQSFSNMTTMPDWSLGGVD